MKLNILLIIFFLTPLSGFAAKALEMHADEQAKKNIQDKRILEKTYKILTNALIRSNDDWINQDFATRKTGLEQCTQDISFLFKVNSEFKRLLEIEYELKKANQNEIINEHIERFVLEMKATMEADLEKPLGKEVQETLSAFYDKYKAIYTQNSPFISASETQKALHIKAVYKKYDLGELGFQLIHLRKEYVDPRNESPEVIKGIEENLKLLMNTASGIANVEEDLSNREKLDQQSLKLRQEKLLNQLVHVELHREFSMKIEKVLSDLLSDLEPSFEQHTKKEQKALVMTKLLETVQPIRVSLNLPEDVVDLSALDEALEEILATEIKENQVEKNNRSVKIEEID